LPSLTQRLDDGDFVEHVTYAGNSYGTSKSQLEEIKRRNKVSFGHQICLLEIDIKGARVYFEGGNQANALFFAPPNIEELRKRLQNRGTDKPESIERRIEIAKNELEAAKACPFLSKRFVNDDFDSFYAEVLGHLKSLYSNIAY